MFVWITDRLSDFYASARSAPDGIPVISRSVIYNFCSATSNRHRFLPLPGPDASDLYHNLQQIVSDHCVLIRMQVFPFDLTTADSARAGIRTCLAQLQRFKDLAARVTHLVEHLERSWVRPGIDAGRKNLFLVSDIHRQRWREDMLLCDGESVEFMTWINFMRHAGRMLLRLG